MDWFSKLSSPPFGIHTFHSLGLVATQNERHKSNLLFNTFFSRKESMPSYPKAFIRSERNRLGRNLNEVYRFYTLCLLQLPKYFPAFCIAFWVIRRKSAIRFWRTEFFKNVLSRREVWVELIIESSWRLCLCLRLISNEAWNRGKVETTWRLSRREGWVEWMFESEWRLSRRKNSVVVKG